MSWFFSDARRAARNLLRSPSFSLPAVVMLALGIGANTAIFSVVDAVLLRPLPVMEPDQLVVLHNRLPDFNLPKANVSAIQYAEYSAHKDLFQATAALAEHSYNLTGTDRPIRLQVMRTTASVLPLFGVEPVLGRSFTDEDDTYGARHVMLLSYAMWRQMFGGKPEARGKVVQLDGVPFEIIGVLPERLERLYPAAQAWIPLGFGPPELSESKRWSLNYTMVARLRQRIGIEQVRAAMDLDAKRILGKEGVQIGRFGIAVNSFTEERTQGTRQPLFLVLSMVGLVLLVACANISNLLLARTAGRSVEVAVRSALGAPRKRIAFEFLIESLLIALSGGALGVALGQFGIAVLVRLAPSGFLNIEGVRLDSRVLGFAFCVSFASAFIFGLWPALTASGTNLADTLKQGGRGGLNNLDRNALRKVLISSEIAVTFVLMVCSGLLVRSLTALLNVDPGFDPRRVVTMRVTLPSASYPDISHVSAFSDAVLRSVSAIPGVMKAAMAEQPPFFPDIDNTVFAIRDSSPQGRGPQPHANIVDATPTYFSLLGIPLLKGRIYTESEMSCQACNTNPLPPAAIIDGMIASEFWPGKDPLGRQIQWYPDGPWATVVGMVGSVHSGDLAAKPVGTIYLPSYGGQLTLLIKTEGDPIRIVATVRDKIREIDSSLPAFDVMTMEQRLATSLGQRRFAAILVTVFAALSLLLSLVGLNSVMSYLTMQRTQEIAIRMALGASTRTIVRLVLLQGLRTAVTGIVIGAGITLFATRIVASQLYDVRSADPWTLLITTVVILIACGPATYLPAHRAMQLDPVTILRHA